MIEIVNQILDFLIRNYALYMVVTMSIIVSLTIFILSLVKKPIKALTGRIKDDRVRKLANKMFILFAFGLSAAVWVLLQIISPAYFQFEGDKILLTGAFSIVIYALGDGVITKSRALEMVNEIIKEPEKDKSSENKDETPSPDKGDSALTEFLKKVK